MKRRLKVAVTALTLGSIFFVQPVKANASEAHEIIDSAGNATSMVLRSILGRRDRSSKSSKVKGVYQQVLLAKRLHRVDKCSPGVVQIILPGDKKSVCAMPNSEFPAGIYRMDPQSLNISPLGSSSTGQNNYPQTPTTPQYPQTPTTPQYPQTPTIHGYPQTPTMHGYPPAPTMPRYSLGQAQPAILNSSNPYQPISPVAQIHIKQMVASKGLMLAACSQSPVVVFSIGQYTACTYPNAQFPSGRYQLISSPIPY